MTNPSFLRGHPFHLPPAGIPSQWLRSKLVPRVFLSRFRGRQGCPCSRVKNPFFVATPPSALEPPLIQILTSVARISLTPAPFIMYYTPPTKTPQTSLYDVRSFSFIFFAGRLAKTPWIFARFFDLLIQLFAPRTFFPSPLRSTGYRSVLLGSLPLIFQLSRGEISSRPCMPFGPDDVVEVFTRRALLLFCPWMSDFLIILHPFLCSPFLSLKRVARAPHFFFISFLPQTLIHSGELPFATACAPSLPPPTDPGRILHYVHLFFVIFFPFSS